MTHNVYLPQLELTMASVTVVGILVREGDAVAVEQALVEVETQKATSEVPSPVAGYVRRICVRVDDTIGERELVCILTDTADEAVETIPSRQAEKVSAESAITPPVSELGVEVGVKAAPAARKRARELGVDLLRVVGTGIGGRITTDDVELAKPSTDINPPTDGPLYPLSSSRLALIGQMQKSLREIPQFHVARRMDVSPFLAKIKGITFTHRLIRGIAAALVRHPALRTRIDTAVLRVESVSVAIAMDTPHGLVAAAIRSADSLSLEQISDSATQLRKRAESGSLRREELTNAPFAVSNLGMLGIDFFNPFVFYGQTAVLGVGRATNGSAWFNLAVDHRIVDGAEAARFLETLQQEILQS